MNSKNKVYSNYEEVKKADINEIWEVVILDTYKGTRRLEYLMTEDLIMASNSYQACSSIYHPLHLNLPLFAEEFTTIILSSCILVGHAYNESCN